MAANLSNPLDPQRIVTKRPQDSLTADPTGTATRTTIASVPVEDFGRGVSGTIAVYPAFHALTFDPALFLLDATRLTFTRTPSPAEMRALVLLHEVAHLIGSNPFANGVHTHAAQDPDGKVFNTGLLVKCLGAARFIT